MRINYLSIYWFNVLGVILAIQLLMQSNASSQTSSASGPLDGTLLGKWTYRSFNNNPNQETPPSDLLFGEGTLTITKASDGKLEGNFDFGPGYGMQVSGSVGYGSPPTLQFEARGTGVNNGDWRYGYTAYLSFQFPQATDQRPSLVGTIVRLQPHSGGKAPAGVTASWIAVKQDSTGVSPLAMMTKESFSALGNASMMKSEPTKESTNDTPMVIKSNSAKVLRKYLEDSARRAENPVPVPQPKVLKSLEKGKPGAMLMQRAAPSRVATVAPTRQPSLQPETVTSQNGVLKLDLVVDYNKDVLMIGKDPVHLRTYNGKLVGPVLRAKAGDTLSITVHNKLPNVPPPTPGFMNGHHDWNVTNLHFHGLHVAPQGTPDAESDNVLLEILPGKSQHYEVHIPQDHPAGTFWYHAHRHGSTAADVASGVAGALIIDRSDNKTNLDAIPEVAAAAQEVMVLQAVPYLKNGNVGEIELASAEDMFSPGDFFRLKRYTTVNGLKIPTLTLSPGEVRRLRIVATGQREFVQLRVARDAEGNIPENEKMPFYEVATDGLVTGRLTEVQDLELQPGYRSDALIRPAQGASGTYYLVDMNSVTSTPGLLPNDPRPTGADGSPERTSIIAIIKIAGTPLDMQLPDPAALLTQRLPDLQDSPDLFTQHAYYGIITPEQGGVNYFLSNQDIPRGTTPSGRELNPNETRYLPLGHTERWQVGSRNSAGINVAHPFHIHVNPFLIKAVFDDQGNDVLVKEFGGSVWRDTLAMKQNYTYTLLTKYVRYTGRYVNHCHILDHEDNGMMEIVEVYDPATTPPRSSPMGLADVTRAAGGATPSLLEATPGKPTLVVVVRSLDCGLCRNQIKAFEKAAQSSAWPKDLDLVFVAPDDAQRTAEARTEGLVKKGRLISDTNDTTLKSIDARALSEERGHGILLLNSAGTPLFKSASAEPLLDPDALRPHFDMLRADTASVLPAAGAIPRVSIAVWNTPSPDDDFLTWAPTPCTIRLDTPAVTDLIVTLTNDPQGPIPSGRTTPLDGDVAFAAKLSPGQTAKGSTLTLTLPKDGSAVPFFIAGKFPRASTKNKDCIIEIHAGPANGPIIGTHAQMVRIRKDHRTLTQFERDRFLHALDYLHRTAVAPEGGDMYMHFVRMHKAAAFGLYYDPSKSEPPYPWPDLSHKGPGFISWHRAFLLAFERTLQETHPDVALPYWVMPEPSQLFTPDFLGANPVNDSRVTEAIFSASNPLKNWTADIDGIVDQKLQRRGFGRNPGDKKFGPFFRDSDLFTLKSYSHHPLMVNNEDIKDPVNSFAGMLEQNPHNVGHNWIGPWMANCMTSPRDPIFWVFHTGFDRQWAKWQLTKDRFNPDGSGDSFCPTGTYDSPGPLCDPETPPPPTDCDTLDPNACVAVNHHLSDQLWPWNGKFGKGSSIKNSYPNEDIAKPFLKPFPAAIIPGLFPAAELAITNGDMIDFMGKTPNRLPMGFCYDDTPFEKGDVESPAVFATLKAASAETLQAKGALNTLEAAATILNAPQSQRDQMVKDLRTLQDNSQASVESRNSALRILAQQVDQELPFTVIRSNDPKNASLKPEAIRLLSEFMTLHPRGPTRQKEVMELLEKSLSAPDQETRSEAMWALVGHHAPAELITMLNESIASKSDAIFPVEEAIQGLVASGVAEQSADLLRPLLTSPDPAVQVAAISALSRDPASMAIRVEFAQQRAMPLSVRTAAVQSLDPADPSQFATVLMLATTSGENPTLRAEAISLVGLWARSSQVPLSQLQLTGAREDLTSIPDASALGLEPAISLALRSINDRLIKAP
jgi:FtsP/CotA-like multicopper oxidase with cupredoxin domain